MKAPLLKLLGPTTIGNGTDNVVLTGSLVERAVWALYREHPNPVSTIRLAEYMWDGDRPPTWASAFRTHMTRLRRLLERHCEGPQIRRDSAGYALDIPEGSVDVDVFLDLIRRAQTTSTPNVRYVLVAAAAQLFQGEPFHGNEEGELRELADRLLGMREDAVRQRRLLAIELGRPGEVINEFALIPDADFIDAMSVEPLVAAHISVGNHTQARKILSAHREALERVGLEPGSGITALERRLVRTVIDEEYATKRISSLPTHLSGTFVHVGRSDHRRQIIEAVHSEDLSFVLLQGPGGIGKSHLARAIAAEASEQKVAVLATWVDENPAPAHPIDELVRDFTLPDSVPSSELLDTLLSTLVELTPSHQLIVVFEDLHYADLATAKILRRLLRRDPIEGVTFVFTARERVANPGTAQFVRELQQHNRTRTIQLSPLSREETFELVQHRRELSPSLGWTLAGRLHRASGGFPLLVDLLLSEHLDGPEISWSNPIQLDDAIRASTIHLTESELDILVTAALVGIECDAGIVATAANVSVAKVLDAGDRGAELGLTAPVQRPLIRFRHSLIQHVLPTTRPRVWRCLRSRRLAEMFATRADANFEVAFHLAHALPGETEGILLDEILDRVESLQSELRWEEALAVLEVVEPLVRMDVSTFSAKQRFRTSKLIAFSSDGSADSELSRSHFRQAVAIARNEANSEWLFEIAMASGASSQPLDGDTERADWLRDTLEPHAGLAPHLRVEALAEYVYLRSMNELDLGTLDLARELQGLATTVGTDRANAFNAHAQLVTLLPSPNPHERLRQADEATAVGASATPEVAATPHLVKLISLLELGRLAEATHCLGALEQLTSFRERPADRWGLFVIRALLAEWVGDTESANRYTSMARELTSRHHIHGGAEASMLFDFTRTWRNGSWHDLSHYRSTPPTDPLEYIGSALYFAHTDEARRTDDVLQFVVKALLEGAPFLGWLGACMVAAEAAAKVSSRFVDSLFKALEPYSGIIAINGLIAVSTFGPVDRVLSQLAHAQGRTSDGDRYFERACQQAHGARLVSWMDPKSAEHLIDLTRSDVSEDADTRPGFDGRAGPIR